MTKEKYASTSASRLPGMPPRRTSSNIDRQRHLPFHLPVLLERMTVGVRQTNPNGDNPNSISELTEAAFYKIYRLGLSKFQSLEENKLRHLSMPLLLEAKKNSDSLIGDLLRFWCAWQELNLYESPH